MKRNLYDFAVMLSRYFFISFLVQFIAFNTLFGKDGEAQLNTSIHADLHDASITEIFGALKKEANLNFVYDAREINSSQRIEIAGNQLKAKDVLDLLASKLDLSYKKIGHTITIRKNIKDKPAPLTALSFLKRPQLLGSSVARLAPPVIAFSVSGTVSDADGNPLIGVSVQVKGTNRGIVTDEKGHYEINAPKDATLIFSYIGYQTEEVAVNAKSMLNITLKASTNGLNEVVVVGYGTEKKLDLTGAVDQIGGAKLENRPLVNLAQGLQGLIPNLNVSLGNGEPGQGATFNIRGTTSINGGSPLVLVDGVEMDPNLISPTDIASVTVLKDAASAAIYGGRAAYGVILITTKTPPKDGRLKVNYTASYTITRPTRMARYLNSVDYVRMHMQADRNGQISGGTTASNPFTELDSINVVKYYNDPVHNSPVYPDPNSPSLYRYVGNTNWIKEEYPGWAPMTDHNLSLSGGNGKTSYLASMDYFEQDGLAKADNETYKRYNPTIKLNSDVTSWLNLNFKATLNRTEGNKPTPSYINQGASLISSDSRPVMPVYHPDGHFSGQGEWTNPIALALQNGRTVSQANDLWLTGGFALNPVNHLTINGNFNWNFYDANTTEHWKEYPEYGVDGVFLDYFPWTIPDAVQEFNEHDQYTAINLYAQYENTFGKHYIKGMIGYDQELKQYNGFNAYANDLIDQDIPAINLNNDPTPTVGGNRNSWALVGTFFRLNYQYNDKYLVEINGRYDGSSRFPQNNRYVFTPSISAGWRISQEQFFKPLRKVINNLKLRASYGSLANQSFVSSNTTDANLYPYLATLPIGSSGYIFGNQLQPTVGAPGLVSSDFTWENVSTKDAGIDLSMFRERLSTTFDYYIRETQDMLVAGAPLPAVLGTSAPSRNAATLRTQGWELNMQWQDKINSDWSYSVGFVLSDYKARITKYDLNPNQVISSYYPGYQFGQIWGFVTDGFFQTDQEAKSADQSQLYGGQWMAGDIKYKDLNGDGKINYGKNTVGDPGDEKIIGNSTPRYQFGINMSVSYKNFDFTALLQGVGKQDFMPSGGDSFFWGFTSEWAVPFIWNKNYWTPQHPNAYFPVLRFGGGGNFAPQTKYLQNAAYMRLKNISLGYTLRPEFLRKIKIQSLRIYITGENVFEITNLYPAYDPDLLNATAYPLNRAYSAGIQVGL